RIESVSSGLVELSRRLNLKTDAKAAERALDAKVDKSTLSAALDSKADRTDLSAIENSTTSLLAASNERATIAATTAAATAAATAADHKKDLAAAVAAASAHASARFNSRADGLDMKVAGLAASIERTREGCRSAREKNRRGAGRRMERVEVGLA
ncbi:unnamed protein product, partial [Laminaria digitata]